MTGTPIFVVDEPTEIALLMVLGDGTDKDCMGMVMRDGPTEPWYMRIRFRYYVAPGPDAPDEKSVYEVKPKLATDDARDDLARVMRGAFQLLQDTGFGHLLEVAVNLTGETFFEATKNSRFFNMRPAAPEEAAELTKQFKTKGGRR